MLSLRAPTRRGRARAFLLLTLGACESGAPETTAPEPVVVTGTYALVSVGRAPVPAILPVRGVALYEVTGGSLTLRPDTTFARVVENRVTLDGGVRTETDSDRGPFRYEGEEIVLESPDGSRDRGAFDGARVTVMRGGVEWVFER